MEGINEEIKIGIFGGNKKEKIEWLKHANNFFATNILKENELSEDTISNPNFKITINYQNSTIILIPFIEHKIDIPIDKRTDEDIEEDLHYHYDSYIKELHYAIIIEDKRNIIYKMHFNKIFFSFYINVTKEMETSKANELLKTSLPSAIEQITKLKKEYNDFISFSKEKHYNSFLKYAGQYIEYNKMSQIELEGVFNCFERFSFDEGDYNDDSLMILQIFSQKKTNFENKKFSPLKSKCDKFDGNECRSNFRIIPYHAKTRMFLCASCIEKTRNKKRCFKCMNYPLETEMITPFCCEERVYCLTCMLKCINKQKDAEIKKCICGSTLDEAIVQTINYYGINSGVKK